MYREVKNVSTNKFYIIVLLMLGLLCIVYNVLFSHSSILTEIEESQLPGRLFSPSDNCKKMSHHFLLHFSIGMGSYDHHTKYQDVFP